METIKEAWEGILAYLKNMDDISQVAYDTWLACLEPMKIEDGYMHIHVHTNFQRSIIQDCYSLKIEKAIQEVLGLPLKVKIIAGEEPDDGVITHAEPELTPPDASDYEYSFENFIVGPSNKFAHAAAQAVANKPAQYYNPLFIYGASGLGKTHLMYAICNHVKRHNPNINIIYTKGETLTNEVVEAIRTHQTQELRAKYRMADILLVDDVQFIAGKESTQTEFFHTFDALHQANKQIVLTSDRPPKEISLLETRLRNRFEMGLLADIQPPELETRIAIIKRKAQLLGIKISDEIAEYIASQLKTNIRQLEGAVRKMFAHQLLAGEKPSLAVAQSAIQDIRNSKPIPITVDQIISEVARTMNVSPEDIRSSKQSAPISAARQVAIYVVREITSMPMKKIGAEFGNRDHSTIVYARDKVVEKMQRDYAFRDMVNDIIENIRNK